MGWHGEHKGLDLSGHWIITCLIWGQLDFEDPLVEAFLSDVPAEVRGEAVGHIAWSSLHADKVDPDIRERFQQLWDRPVAHVRETPDDRAELSDFYWFVRSEKFEPEWWVPRLKEAAGLHPQLKTRGMIGEQLAAVASAFPRDLLDALRLLLQRDDGESMNNYDLKEHAAAPIIAAALDSDDAQLQKDAHALMNELGASGLIDMEQRVIQLRSK